ncbi:phage baseplate assembly protein V [Yersinia enterocolitica]|uniref:phage baseplate assembly protein V n=1 Tax=Yersinia enterocolitica TaxID=630 RepID=UPI0021E9A6E9|nr:phage baseplate assembly protein V [Yersinia enterocolitica]UYK06099.1 phage baseplate assembly protein V [Yersinia enterocolitica]HDL6706023.1 phage baseplate assembly protein V [Yersinia enterocolitica]HDL7089133.1 phage baseplate assembly protein V [Yersinia enterocolitica]HDM8364818.1 phage baseplate assembly protein V [Yersinia enterocolitica]HEI6707434.1 phage baseplate assembly protein V [Yersinia enterocolitica]
MNILMAGLKRLLANIIRIGIVSDIDLTNGLCRVRIGNLETDWLNWLTLRAGRVRFWSAPSQGEQVMVLSIGGELTTGFVLPAIFSDANSAPSQSADAMVITFPDGARFEYEPETSHLAVTGIATAVIDASDSVTVTAPNITCTASVKITLNTPEVECTHNLTTATLDVKKGGTMGGDITHSGGQFSSNGVVVDKHNHGGVQRGGDWTEGVK